MVALSDDTWRDFAWVCAGLTAFTTIVLFFFLPETTFDRPETFIHEINDSARQEEFQVEMEISEKIDCQSRTHSLMPRLSQGERVKVSLSSVWKTTVRYSSSISWVKVFFLPVLVAIYPAVLWAIVLYGTSLAPNVVLT